MVSFEEIENNEFNLNLPRYINSQEAEDLQDIEGHLMGGVPARDVDALARYWAVCPQLRQVLFKDNRPGYLDLAVDKAAIKPIIYKHPEFAAFMSQMNAHFATWRKKSAVTLRQLEARCHPKEIIAPDGWKAETYRIIEKDKKGKEKDKGWTCDLVPKALIVSRYFAKEQESVDQLRRELESVTARMTELEEENSGEESAFAGLDKANKASVSARLKEIKGDEEAKDEANVLNEWLKLANEEAGVKKRRKEAEARLDAKAYTKYPKLSEEEIKTLVVDDKWLAALDAAIHGEMDRSQTLTQRVKELAERYETPMPQMINRVAELEAKVNGHLKGMGFAWK
jgi:type I restriction enzyme M protein